MKASIEGRSLEKVRKRAPNDHQLERLAKNTTIIEYHLIVNRILFFPGPA